MRRRYIWAEESISEIVGLCKSMAAQYDLFSGTSYMFMNIGVMFTKLGKMFGQYRDHFEYGDCDSDYEEDGSLDWSKAPKEPDILGEFGDFSELLWQFKMPYKDEMRYRTWSKPVLFRVEYFVRILEEFRDYLSYEIFESGYLNNLYGLTAVYLTAVCIRGLKEKMMLLGRRWRA